MNQPKKLHPVLEYSSDIFIPEIDMDLDEFIEFHNEHLDSHNLYESLKDLNIEHVGESVFITEDIEIDSNQFEEKEDRAKPQKLKRKSFFRKFIN